MKNPIDLFIKDLSRYPEKDLRIMSLYYDIPFSNKDEIVPLLAVRIFKSANMGSPPYRSLQEAREKGGAQGVMKMIQWQQQQARELAEKEEKQEDTIELEKCYNQTSLTDEPFTKDTLPDLQIKFIKNNSEPDEKYQCYHKKEYKQLLNSEGYEMAQWVQYLDPENEKYSELIEQLSNDPEFYDLRNYPIDESGRYGGPSSERRFYKHPTLSVYFTNIDFLEDDKKEYYAYLVGENIRIGNLEHSFAESRVHGQYPGYNIYTLIPEDMDQQVALRDELFLRIEKEFGDAMQYYIEQLDLTAPDIVEAITGYVMDASDIAELTDDELLRMIYMYLTNLSISDTLKLYKETMDITPYEDVVSMKSRTNNYIYELSNQLNETSEGDVDIFIETDDYKILKSVENDMMEINIQIINEFFDGIFEIEDLMDMLDIRYNELTDIESVKFLIDGYSTNCYFKNLDSIIHPNLLRIQFESTTNDEYDMSIDIRSFIFKKNIDVSIGLEIDGFELLETAPSPVDIVQNIIVNDLTLLSDKYIALKVPLNNYFPNISSLYISGYNDIYPNTIKNLNNVYNLTIIMNNEPINKLSIIAKEINDLISKIRNEYDTGVIDIEVGDELEKLINI